MTVKPEILGGFRDMLPVDALLQQYVIDKVRTVYEAFGFVPLETPCMERVDVLIGENGDFNKSIFLSKIVRGAEDRNVNTDGWDQEYGMRFDLTVSLARVVAAYPDLVKPFKRYQLGKVWRGEKPQAGRYREFFQFDFDTIGSDSILADVEVIQVMCEVMKALGINRYVVKFNSRKVLNGLAEVVGCSDKAKEVFRIIDKLDKVGQEGVKHELMRLPDNEFDDNALAMSQENADKIIAFLNLRATSPQEALDNLRSFFTDNAGSGVAGLRELEEITQNLIDLGVPQENWAIDLSVARGLDYYTGPVFETYLDDLPGIGSVFSGGRFDGLTNRFMSESNIPGVGASVGIDRLVVALTQLKLLESRESITDVLVTIFEPSLKSQSLQLADKMRQQGIITEVYLGNDRTMRAQFAYATKKAIPYVAVLGPDEVQQGKVALKDMAARKQEVLTHEQLFAKLDSIKKKS